MNKIYDKMVILFCCCISFYGTKISMIHVVSLLSIVCVTCICQYMGKGKSSLAAQIAYLILCLINPSFMCFIPIIIYDVICEKRYYLSIAYVFTFALGFSYENIWQLILIIGITMISVILNLKTTKLEKLEQTLIETRDNSAEMNMLLTDKNKHLIDNQDYEIHLATLKERNRIAREIHDNVGHLLSRSILQTGALQITIKDDEQKESLANLSDTLNNAMTTIRNSVHDLHDDSIDLKAVLIDAVKPLKDYGLITKIDFDFTNHIQNNIKLCLISILKESVSNIIKHSNAEKVFISLYEHPGFYQLMVEDNGKCSDFLCNSGMGISNMRDRVESLDGLIQINSSEKGFRIFITLKK